jgi:hypothetical protein
MSNEIRIARLTYNQNRWVFPSGPEGKSRAKMSYETTYGYGHEEWLLDLSKLIDGYHYGFLEPINKSRVKYQWKEFDIYLFTVNSTTNEKLWVGKINNLEVIDEETSDRVKKIYERQGWYQEMKNDLKDLELDESRMDKWPGIHLFNIRFEPADFERFPDNTLIAPDDPSISSYHYVLLHAKNIPKIEQVSDGKFVLGRCNPERRFRGKSIKKKIEEKTIEYPFIHHKISVALEESLKQQFDDVYAEHATGFKTSIDLVAVKGRKITFYEIKTSLDIRTCIRHAIGQLMQYSYFPTKKIAKELVIVTPYELKDANTINYIKHLRESVGLPIRYMFYDLPNKKIAQVI